MWQTGPVMPSGDMDRAIAPRRTRVNVSARSTKGAVARARRKLNSSHEKGLWLAVWRLKIKRRYSSSRYSPSKIENKTMNGKVRAK